MSEHNADYGTRFKLTTDVTVNVSTPLWRLWRRARAQCWVIENVGGDSIRARRIFHARGVTARGVRRRVERKAALWLRTQSDSEGANDVDHVARESFVNTQEDT